MSLRVWSWEANMKKALESIGTEVYNYKRSPKVIAAAKPTVKLRKNYVVFSQIISNYT